MKTTIVLVLAIGSSWFFGTSGLIGQDWTQWRGDHRNGMASGFQAPDEWPEALTKKWSVEVGNGVASPSIKGQRVYVIALQDGDEIMRCLDASSGDEIWRDQYEAVAASGAARGFPGTRASPAIADGKVVTLGVNGTVSCWDAESGELSWRNNDHVGEVPRFSTSSSPMIVNGLCVLQFGSESNGGIVAYDLDFGRTEMGVDRKRNVVCFTGWHFRGRSQPDSGCRGITTGCH